MVNIPVAELAHRLPDLESWRAKQIVTVCRSGGRAHTAAQIRTQAGFEHVSVLEGGMQKWPKRISPRSDRPSTAPVPRPVRNQEMM